MLSVNHVYLCDFNKNILRSREVVQTFDRTSLSDRATYRVRDIGNPAKIRGSHVPASPKRQESRVKNKSTVRWYL